MPNPSIGIWTGRWPGAAGCAGSSPWSDRASGVERSAFPFDDVVPLVEELGGGELDGAGTFVGRELQSRAGTDELVDLFGERKGGAECPGRTLAVHEADWAFRQSAVDRGPPDVAEGGTVP